MEIGKDLIKGNVTTILLGVLKDGEKYGYEIIQDIDESSKGAFKMKEGTLYPLLHSLEHDGYVTSKEKKAESGRKRKYYKLTRSGSKLLKSKKEEWEHFKVLIDQFVARVYG